MILTSLVATSLTIATHTLTDEPQPRLTSPNASSALTDPRDERFHMVHDGPLYFRVGTGFVNGRDSDGPNGNDIDYDTGFLISAGVGKRVAEFEHGFGVSAEIDGVLTALDAHTHGGVKAVKGVVAGGVLFDGIVDYTFDFEPRLSLYGGFGLGVAAVDVDTHDDAGHDFDVEDGPFLAWQGKTGAAWRFAPNMRVHAGLRVFSIEDVGIDDDIGNSDFDLETRQAALEAGLIFDI